MRPLTTIALIFINLICIGQNNTFTSFFCKIDSSSLSECNCDSLKIISPPSTNTATGVFDGPGTCWTSKAYSQDHRLSKCGFFKNEILYYGLSFTYDSFGSLQVEKYYEGRNIGTCNPLRPLVVSDSKSKNKFLKVPRKITLDTLTAYKIYDQYGVIVLEGKTKIIDVSRLHPKSIYYLKTDKETIEFIRY